MQLSRLGLQLSIDDFGTGYSSLAYLKRLPVREIKIDKSFVRDMARDENDAVIVKSTIDLGHNLGLKVVAEGVESEKIYGTLAAMGCDYAQGYFLSKPLSTQKMTVWLDVFMSSKLATHEPVEDPGPAVVEGAVVGDDGTDLDSLRRKEWVIG